MVSHVTLQVLESYYGQDLDSGHHGSGFPLPPFRQRLLDLHLQKQAVDKATSRSTKGDSDTGDESKQRTYTQEETVYSEHAWNINNLPRCKVRRFDEVKLQCAEVHSTMMSVAEADTPSAKRRGCASSRCLVIADQFPKLLQLASENSSLANIDFQHTLIVALGSSSVLALRPFCIPLLSPACACFPTACVATRHAALQTEMV